MMDGADGGFEQDEVETPALPSHRSGLAQTLSNVVRQQPGIHFRGLQSAASVASLGQLRYHVDQLKRDGVLVEVKDGGFTRFFLAGAQDPALRIALAHFARPVPRRIAQHLLEEPLSWSDLRARLGCADSTLGYHLNRMGALGDVERRHTRSGWQYVLTEPQLVERAIRMHAAAEVRGGAVEGPQPNRWRGAAGA
jgi:predicted transcriptional regulator